MKRLLSALIVYTMCFITNGSTLRAIPLGGDPNYDGKINLSDIIFLVNYVFKSGPAPQFPFMGNANEDCNTNIQDIIVLVNYVFKGGAEPKGWDCSFDTVYFTGLNGSDPFLTYNGKKIYFSDRGTLDLVYSEWDSTTDSWGPKINLGPNINTIEDESYPSVTIDEKKLYFTSYQRPGGFGLRDIWVSEWDSISNEWMVPQNLGNTINTAGTDYGPFISHDQNRLYFSRSGDKIYVSNWDSGNWNSPIPLGQNVNYDGSEEQCSLTPDEQTIYFVRWVVNDPFFGHPKIFVSHWTGTDWGIALRLGAPVNEAGVGSSTPFISSDGKLYYRTTRNEQSGIWVASKK